jgi:hypothetical protein
LKNSGSGRQFPLWIVWVVFALFFLAACHPQKGIDRRDSAVIPQPPKAAETVPLSVETVQTFGFWSEDNTGGSYRLLLMQEGYEHISHRLIIEWIAFSQTPGRALIKRIAPTLGKTAHPIGHAIAVTRIKTSEQGGATVHLDLVHPITQARQSAALRLGAPGVYEIRWGAGAAGFE